MVQTFGKLKEWKFLRLDPDLLAGLRIVTLIAFIILDLEGAKAADLDAVRI